MSTPPRVDSSARQRSRHIAAIVALLAVFVGLVLVWSANQRSQRRAVEGLPQAERRELYERTLRTLQSPSCDPQRSKGLDDYCREQADFIVQFPECDAACAELANRHRQRPTR
jgi:hypothetical protein